MNFDIITLIKCCAILYISILYTFTGVIISNILESYFFPKSLEKIEEGKSQFQLIIEISIIFGILGIVSFFGRNFVEYIPFPFDKYYGFDYSRVQNLTSSLVFTVSTMTCVVLTKRIALLKESYKNKF